MAFCSHFALAFILSVVLSISGASDARCDCPVYGTWTCCHTLCVRGYSCLNFYCIVDTDCSAGEKCCGNVCTHGDSCIGHSCSSDSQCKQDDESCCFGSCRYSHDCDGGSLAGSLLIGVIFLFALTVTFIFGCFLLRSPVGRTTATKTALQSISLHPSYTEFIASLPYQADYLYHPPQYIEYPSVTGGVEQPPPFHNSAPEESGGCSYPQRSYGTLRDNS